MKLVIQRVTQASVTVDDKQVASIKKGYMVLVGLGPNDTMDIAERLLTKLLNLRIFSDQEGKMNLSVRDVDGDVLLVSQFTLYANCKKGNRPSFIEAMPPAQAEPFFYDVVKKAKELYPNKVQSGIFGADMKVGLINDGPTTIILHSDE